MAITHPSSRHLAGWQKGAGSLMTIEVAALVGYALLLAVYFVARAGGHWAENDSSDMAQAIRAMLTNGRLDPELPHVYPNGYGYTALAAFIVRFTGLSVPVLQQVVFPLVSALLVLPAFALYREMTGSRRAAVLAVLLLFLQPEFLFVILRGSHERMLRALMLIAFWLLLRSIRLRDRPAQFALHVGLFYLTTFGLIATNALFGISFAVAIAAAMAFAWVAGRWRRSLLSLAGQTAGRLAPVAVTVTALGMLFMLYIYPSAGRSFQLLSTLGSKLAALFLSTNATAVDPYVAVLGGWINLPTYALVSMGDYLLILLSGIVWLRWGIRWLLGRSRPSSMAMWLLWLLYGAFALQGVLSITLDRGGQLGNLEHRSFPSFAMVATPLLAMALVRLRLKSWLRPAAAAGIAGLSVLALLKATNEPSLSNKWAFYTPAELQGMEWTDAHTRFTPTWAGLDDRLPTAYALTHGDANNGNQWDQYHPKSSTQSLLVSDVIRLQSSRLAEPLPLLDYDDRAYDNGTVQLYRVPPRTPYQR